MVEKRAAIFAVKKRPLIGVTGPTKGGASAWLFTRFAVSMAGGKALRITPLKPLSAKKLDGLIIGGGADVNPELYNERREELIRHLKQEPGREGKLVYFGSLLIYPFITLIRYLSHANTGDNLDKDRDALESSLIEQADQKGLPILGICRGAQLINVYFGGSLYQNLDDFYVEVSQIRSVLPRKPIQITPGSQLERVFGVSKWRVNALHNQAVNNMGKNIVPVAKDPGGVIQAFEHQRRTFLIGVQWHPEYLPQDNKQRRIFNSLVQAAKTRIKIPTTHQ